MKQYSQLEIKVPPSEPEHVVRKVEFDELERQVDEINELLNGVSESLLTLENTVNGGV